jgi:hypothetical protein
MELLDRYLKSIHSALPQEQADDIVSELSENISSQIEDKEGELGRPLNETEIEVILKHHGHPLIVAGRYRQENRSVSLGRQWIGPVLFPFYIRVLAVNLGVTGMVVMTVFMAMLASGQSATIREVSSSFLYQSLLQFAIVTAVFAVADRYWTKYPDRWDLHKTKSIWHPGFAMQSARKSASHGLSEEARVSRFASIAQFVALGVGLVWLGLAQQAPLLIFGPAAFFLKPLCCFCC